jgi:acetate---CoA ligase (ADP-forming)
VPEDPPRARNLRALFDPRAVAILGASGTPAKWGNWLARSALRGGGRRAVYLINRAGQDVCGRPTYPSLRGLPEPVDLVVIAIGAAGFEEAVDDALRAGARAIVAITAGMGELGQAGRVIERRAVERVRAAGAVLVGPNCLGVADTETELNVSFGDFATGSVGLISQSGNLALELASIAMEAGLGFSRFVSVGNQADLEVAELVESFSLHDPTQVIAVYAEDFRDGRAFAGAALGALKASKPVILLTVGSSPGGARAARSHTGALVSASVAVDAACRASGIHRVTTPREMVELAQGLLMPHLPRGRRVGIVGDGGGHVALAADLANAHGLELPSLSHNLTSQMSASLPPAAATQNPIDLAGGGEQDFFNYERAVRLLAASGEVDAVLLTGFFGGYGQDSVELARIEAEVAQAMANAAEGGECPLVIHTMYSASSTLEPLRSMHVPVYGDVNSAVRVLAHLVDRMERPPTGIPPLPRPAAAAAPQIRDGYFEARVLMATAGIPLVEAHRVAELAEAQAAAAELGFPVVLKALGSSHKSDLGAVRLGIAGDAELETAFLDMALRLDPAAFSVERTAPARGSVELLVGVRRDRRFGPVLVIGLGGVYTELLSDVAVALAPVSYGLAEQLIRSLRGAPLLLGARGGPILDVAAAARAAVALSRLVAESPHIAEAEINPLLVSPEGVLALDARIIA